MALLLGVLAGGELRADVFQNFVLIPRGSLDKFDYHLFQPVPTDLMRPLRTDRPDQTESPFTVDAGHFQVEVGLIDGVLDRNRSGGADERSEVWGFTALNVKLGLLNQVDLQVVLDGFVAARVENKVAGVTEEESGLGDLQTRVKINLWGNDDGRTAFGVMPFIKWPLAESGVRNGKTEGGLIFPFAMELPAEWGLGLMAEIDWVRDAGGGYDTEYFNTVTVGREIYGPLAGYVEFAARFTPERNAQWQGQLGGGLTYAFDKNTQLDFGCNIGVTRAAPDLNSFIGMTWRY